MLQLHFKRLIDDDALAAAQARIAIEEAEARRWQKAAIEDVGEVLAAFDELDALLADTHSACRKAGPTLRRMMNQALFERLEVWDDLIGYAEPVEEVRLARELASWASRNELTGRRPLETQNPRSLEGSGSNVLQMVRPSGLEPPRAFAHSALNAARLPIPPRPRGDRKPSDLPSPRPRLASVGTPRYGYEQVFDPPRRRSADSPWTSARN